MADNFVIESLMEITLKFCQKTTLHGFRHIFEIKKPEKLQKSKSFNEILSQIIWIISCSFGAGVAIALIHLSWVKYKVSPTITTVETNNYPIWNVPFPAITLCSNNKVYGPATEDIKRKLMNKGLSEDNVYGFLSKLSRLISPSFTDSSYFRTYQYLKDLNYTSQSLMLEIMHPCRTMIKNCWLLGKDTPCHSLFRITMSTEGFCCSFNYKAIKNSLEISHRTEVVVDQLNAPIYRVAGAGENVGLSVLLDTECESYISYKTSVYGIKILVHEPDVFPEVTVNAVFVQPGMDVSIAVVPTVMDSNPAIRELPPRQRNCLFDNEKILRTTNRYTYKTCLSECVVSTILKVCGCIPFFYPHLHLIPYSLTSRQCALNDVNCLDFNSYLFSSLKPEWTDDPFNENKTGGMECECLPSCSENNYELQTTSCIRKDLPYLRIPEHVIPQAFRVNDTEMSKLTTVNVFFKDISCIKYRRDVYMTWDALIGVFGGIFSLCLGGSMISLFECAYFYTFRFINQICFLDRTDELKIKRSPKIQPIIVRPVTINNVKHGGEGNDIEGSANIVRNAVNGRGGLNEYGYFE